MIIGAVRINKKKCPQDITPASCLVAAAKFHFDMHHTGNYFKFQLNCDGCAGRGRRVRKDNSVYSGRWILRAGEISGGLSLVDYASLNPPYETGVKQMPRPPGWITIINPSLSQREKIIWNTICSMVDAPVKSRIPSCRT